MGIKEILDKPIFKKWWFWVIILGIFMIGVIAGNPPVETMDDDDTTTIDSLEEKDFDKEFDALCDAITDIYQSIGTVSCQDENTWENNNKRSPGVFPYEYRDIDIAFGDEITYEIKVVANPDNMDYFRESYLCSEIYAGDGSCLVSEAKDNILYSIIFYNENNQEELLRLSEGLKTQLNK